MNIIIIHGQSHQGSTCQIARILAKKLGGEVNEFFLPRDFGEFCVGCTQCFTKTHTACPHYEKLNPITEAIDRADVIILASPVYVYHATGAMKAFLDHYGWRWMVHRPDERMFQKQGVVISTAAGAGTKTTNRDMEDSLFFWGVAKIYRIGVAVSAVNWNAVTGKKRALIEKATDAIASRIRSGAGRIKPGPKTRFWFSIMRMIQKKWGFNQADMDYWKEKGWLGSRRPWR